MAKKTPDLDKLEALARYNEAEGVEFRDQKVKPLKKAATAAPARRPRRAKKLTNELYRDMMVESYRLQHLKKAEDLPPHDVTRATRYDEVVMWNVAGDERLDRILERHKWVMGPQGITGGELKLWREQYMLMNREQLAAFIRVTERTVRNWETGVSEIPFSMWWMVHCTLQDPDYFLTRPGFHDFYVGFDHDTKQPVLCSYSYPDIRYSPTDLYVNRCALNEVITLRAKLEQKEQELADLTLENTRLRQLLKEGAVTDALEAMHAHIGDLLKRMHTADVLPLRPAANGN
jgi:hypothetical protein